MTNNKLPVVGKRYREIGATEPWKQFELKEIRDGVVFHEGITRTRLDCFFDIYEEIPGDKVEVVVPDNTYVCKHCLRNAKYDDETFYNRDNFLLCRECFINQYAKDQGDHIQVETIDERRAEFNFLAPKPAQAELSDEVKEVMKNIRENLSGTIDILAYGELTGLARRLLEALDKQFGKKPSESLADQTKLENPSICPPEEAREESIWKPVSELPEDDLCRPYLIKTKDMISIGEYRYFDDIEEGQFFDHIMQCGKKVEGEEIDNVISYATLTDFINDIERLKERVRKLENKG